MSLNKEKKECILCHRLKIDPIAYPHEWDNCPKRIEYLEKLETQCSWCNFCCNWTRYYTDLDYACLGPCVERMKRQDLTKDRYIRPRPNKYMIKRKKGYNSY